MASRGMDAHGCLDRRRKLDEHRVDEWLEGAGGGEA
jgi:hypothetical protein